MIQLLVQKIMQDTRERLTEGAGNNVSCESAGQYVHAESQEITNTKEDNERMKEIKEVSVNGKKM